MTEEKKVSLKDKYIALIHATEVDDDLIMIENGLKNFVEYINSVIMMVFGSEIIKKKYGPDQRRAYLQGLDTKRHVCHEACISSLKLLNRYCLLYGVEQVAEDVNLEDRYAVADYIGAFILEVYSNEIHESRAGLCESIAITREGKCYNVNEVRKLIKQ